MKKWLSILLAAMLIMSVVTACKSNDGDAEDRDRDDKDTNFVDEDNYGPFSYSDGINENGYLEGITALEQLELFQYLGIEIPESELEVSDAELEQAFNNRASEIPPEEARITNRPVEDGDLVNIDFVGSVDGEEFEGGNSRLYDDRGMNVTAGSREFIDDFLTQIIGSSPGDTLDVNVTFPQDYDAESLAGQEALFVVDIHYIVDSEKVKDSIREELKQAAIERYVMNYIETVPVTIPESFIELLEENTKRYYAEKARESEISLLEYISRFEFDSLEALLEDEREGIYMHARVQIVMQAIAEDLGLLITEDEVRDYLAEFERDFDDTVSEFGLPYLKQVVMHDVILKLVIEEVVVIDDSADAVDNGDDNSNEDDDSDDESDE